MKKRNVLLPLSVAALLTPLFVSFLTTEPSYNEVEAYTINSLPTTIDLNDTSSSDIRSYYTSVTGLRGDNLLLKLKEVIDIDNFFYLKNVGPFVYTGLLVDILFTTWFFEILCLLNSLKTLKMVFVFFTSGEISLNTGIAWLTKLSVFWVFVIIDLKFILPSSELNKPGLTVFIGIK